MSPDPKAAATRLDAARALIATATGMLAEVAADPLVARCLRAFRRLPEADREAIVRILEREAAWVEIAEETADITGIRVKPNPHASLYVHVCDAVTGTPVETAPLARDQEVVRLGLERFVSLLPLAYQEGVYAQWAPAARQLARSADPGLRAAAVRLAREVLALVEEGDTAG